MADFVPWSPAPVTGLPTASWWLQQNSDPTYMQQVANTFAQDAGTDNDYTNNVLGALTRSGYIGATNAASGGTSPFESIRQALLARGLGDISGINAQNLSQAQAAAQQLNDSYLSDYGKQAYADQIAARNDTNQLAANGILQSGENTYRGGQRNLASNQATYTNLQSLLDHIDGLNAGRLAAEQAHQNALWAALSAATGRQSNPGAVPFGPGAGNNGPGANNNGPGAGDNGPVPVSTATPAVATAGVTAPPNYVPGNETVSGSIAEAQQAMPGFTPPPAATSVVPTNVTKALTTPVVAQVGNALNNTIAPVVPKPAAPPKIVVPKVTGAVPVANRLAAGRM
jgi:Tfp pilus assembly protein PilX